MYSYRRAAAGALFAAFLLQASPPFAAQNSSVTIYGTLADHSGAVLTGAILTVRELSSGRSWSATTNSIGHYTFVGLQPGRYALSVHQDGFSELERRITLAAGESLNQPLILSLTSVVQQVTVSSGPANDGLTSQEIREGGARDLGEATEGIAGVDKVRKAAIANDIAIRGLFHNNIAMSFDGERLYGACTVQMDPPAYHVDLSEVNHVDVVKGPFDVTTQGALGGFVKVITKTPDVRGIELRSNVSTGSYGYYNPSATFQAGSGSFHSLFGYSYRASEFYNDGNGNKVSDLGSYRNGAENLQAFRTQSVWTKLAFEPAANQRGEIGYTRQQSGNLLYPYMTMDGVFDIADRFSVRYDYLQRRGWVGALHGLVYVDKINHLMDNRLRASAGALPASMNTQVVSYTDGVRLDANLKYGLTAGYEFHRRYWNANGFMIMTSMGMSMTTYTQTLPGVTASVNGDYVAYRRALGERVLITAGARYDHVQTDASKTDPALYEAYHNTNVKRATDSGFSGNVRISWQANGAVSLFTGLGSNIRFPDPQELFFRSDSSVGTGWVGNPLLTHPRNTEYDLGLTAKNVHYTLSPLLFFSKLDNDIILYGAKRLQDGANVTSMTAQSYANAQAHQWGGELTGSASIMDGLTTLGTLSYTRGTKVPQPANNILSSNLFQVPPIRSQLSLRYGRRDIYGEAEGTVTGRQDHVDTDENEQGTSGFSIFSLKLGYTASNFHLEGGVNNVLAREYTEYLSYARNPYTNGIRLPEPGRNFFVNLSYSFGRSRESRFKTDAPQ